MASWYSVRRNNEPGAKGRYLGAKWAVQVRIQTTRCQKLSRISRGIGGQH